MAIECWNENALRGHFLIGTEKYSFPVLVAANLTWDSLWSGECTLALASGVNVIITPSPLSFQCGLYTFAQGARQVFDRKEMTLCYDDSLFHSLNENGTTAPRVIDAHQSNTSQS